MPKGRPRKERESPPVSRPVFDAGDVRVGFKKVELPRALPVRVLDVGKLTPEGFLELGKVYKLKEGWRFQAISRTMGPMNTRMVACRKGHLLDTNVVEWSPTVTIPEKHAEDYVKAQKINEEEQK